MSAEGRGHRAGADGLQETTGLEVAIVGMAGRFPGARNLEKFWANLAAGVESIAFFSRESLAKKGVDSKRLSDRNFVPAGAPLEDIDLFDADFFGIHPREAETMDPQQRLFLECAVEALDDAGYDPSRYSGRIAVFGGTGRNTYLPRLASDLERQSDELMTAIGNEKDYVATRVSYKLGLTGPSLDVQTACSTSLVAVHLACQSLLAGECDLALAGGARVDTRQDEGYLAQEGMIFSLDGHCRPFDARAEGT